MSNYVEISGGAVRVWIEQEAIHIRAIDPRENIGDPVELTKSEAIKLANVLTQLANQID